jgi:hypothetical protein
MRPKSLKANFSLKAEQVEEAVVELADRYLRTTKTGCRIVRQPTEFNLADLCAPLIEGWRNGKVGYARGEVSLVFSHGELTAEADLIIYAPTVGDRFLYSKPQATTTLPSLLPTEPQPESATESPTRTTEADSALAEQLQTLMATLEQVVAKQAVLETQLADLLAQRNTDKAAIANLINSQSSSQREEIETAIRHILEQQMAELTPQLQTMLIANLVGSQDSQREEIEAAIRQVLERQTGESTRQVQTTLKTQQAEFTQQVQVALEAQTAKFAQLLANQIKTTAQTFSDRLDAVNEQLQALSTRLDELEILEEPTSEPEFTAPNNAPLTDAEWLNCMKSKWGTVGDYEQFLYTYRIAHAETPLFQTPDWVALCELQWARHLSPTLALLYDLIHAEDGIGYAGADILQQFGLHIDPQTGDRYYIYHRSGFTAYNALWQTVSNPHHSWLPELERLYAMQPSRRKEILQLFGWEQEAIESLASVVERAYRERRTSRDPQRERRDKVLRDHLILLNLSPLTPLTLESIKRAYKQAMKSAHPDTGGSKEQAQKVNEAYRAVLNYYFPQIT